MTDDFIKERRYLHGVSARTVDWYKTSFNAFDRALDSKASIIDRIAVLKERGVSHITINSYLRCVNAYFMWMHKEHGKALIRIPKLKEEQKVLTTLSPAHINALLQARPKGTNQVRAHLLALTILDTGLRASEALGLTTEALDMDNCTVKVHGKGGKHRLVPFSHELRRALYKFQCANRSRTLIFGTKNDTKVSVHNLDRDFKILGKDVGINGIRFSPHTLRHTFAVNWLRKGGDLYMLSRVLGHSNISTTTLYLKSLGVSDIASTAQRVSLLSR